MTAADYTPTCPDCAPARDAEPCGDRAVTFIINERRHFLNWLSVGAPCVGCGRETHRYIRAIEIESPGQKRLEPPPNTQTPLIMASPSPKVGLAGVK